MAWGLDEGKGQVKKKVESSSALLFFAFDGEFFVLNFVTNEFHVIEKVIFHVFFYFFCPI